MSQFDNLQIPRQTIQDGYIRDLNEEYIKTSLSKIRRKLIKGAIDFDYMTTFDRTSLIFSEAEGNIISDKVAVVLANGRWFLSPDRKNIYYSYSLDNGEFRPLMKNSIEKLSFNLLELNIPRSESCRQGRLGEEMQEMFELMPVKV